MSQPNSARYAILADGSWPEASLSVVHREQTQPWPAALQQEADIWWQEQVKATPALYNGLLAALTRFSAGPDRLVLELRTTCYRDQIFSNTLYAQWTPADRLQLAPRALGISALLLSSDDCLFLILRSQHVHEYPSRWDVPGGHIEGSNAKAATSATVFDAIHEELQLELGLEIQAIAESRCIGLVENREIGKPEMAFLISSRLTAQEIRAGAAGAKESYEYIKLKDIAADSSGIRSFLREKPDLCTPSAAGCLRLLEIWLAKHDRRL